MRSTTDDSGLKVAYMMSRFPKLTETFVLYEMLEVISQGIDVQIYPLLREREKVTHPDVARVKHRVHFAPLFSFPVLKANIVCMLRQPRLYFKTLSEVLVGTLGSRNYFLGAIGSFPKAVRFAEMMRSEGVQHIHAHFANHPALAALIVHRLTGIPFSFTAHAHDIFVDRRMLGHKVAASKFAVTISNYNREYIVREAGEKKRSKVHVIHCGVNPAAFSPKWQARNDQSLRIVCVGVLEERKGQWVLIEACRILREAGKDVRCDLVGSGSWRERLLRQANMQGVGSAVRFLGSLTRPEVTDLLSQSDVMVLASVPTKKGKSEGIPVALMEAMAMGLPVVSTRVTGIPELISDGVSGFLVAPGDAQSLSDALKKLHKDPALRESFGIEGRRTVTADFNLQLEAAKLSQLFEQSARGAARDTTQPEEMQSSVA